jgi:large-conductance mechanosensitive channel
VGDSLRDLRRFLSARSLIEIGAAFALATIGVRVISSFVNYLVVLPLHNSDESNDFGGSLFSNGSVTIFHRIFGLESFLWDVVTFALVLGVVALIVRRNRENVFGDETFTECPHCLSEIPVGASVCSSCTREINALTTH